MSQEKRRAAICRAALFFLLEKFPKVFYYFFHNALTSFPESVNI